MVFRKKLVAAPAGRVLQDKSNLPLFEYDRTDVSVNLRRDF